MSYALSAPMQTNPAPPQAAQLGWHAGTQVVFTGLPGTYYWPESPFNAFRLQFAGNGMTGPYILSSATGMFLESGTYSTVTGPFPRIILDPFGPTPPRSYAVLGTFNTPSNMISFMLLQAPSGFIFVAFRIA